MRHLLFFALALLTNCSGKVIIKKGYHDDDPLKGVNYLGKFRIKGKDSSLIWEKTFYRNSQLEYWINYKTNNGEHQPHGKWLCYGENGKIIDRCRIKHGQANGKCRDYYANGNIKSAIKKAMGYNKGQAKFFYENGKLKEKGRYGGTAMPFRIDTINNDIKIDTSRYHYPIEYMVSKQGVWKTYHPNGKLKDRGKYFPGIILLKPVVVQYPVYSQELVEVTPLFDPVYIKIGIWQYWNTEGKLIKEERYDLFGNLSSVRNF